MTVFDDTIDDKYVYGKHSVENLTGLVWRAPYNPYAKREKSIEIIELKSGDNNEVDVKVVKMEKSYSV
jgi:hypothetical protein